MTVAIPRPDGPELQGRPPTDGTELDGRTALQSIPGASGPGAWPPGADDRPAPEILGRRLSVGRHPRVAWLTSQATAFAAAAARDARHLSIGNSRVHGDGRPAANPRVKRIRCARRSACTPRPTATPHVDPC